LEPETAETVGDGVWWAAATLSTVGYGDIAPKTVAGRVLAVVIMVVGVGTFAALTATIASLFVQAEDRGKESDLAELSRQIAGMRQELDALKHVPAAEERPDLSLS
jgi:voltage-gated potassium channel